MYLIQYVSLQIFSITMLGKSFYFAKVLWYTHNMFLMPKIHIISLFFLVEWAIEREITSRILENRFFIIVNTMLYTYFGMCVLL